MIITLNTDKLPFFYLPDSKIHLSFENPGPISIDSSNLTKGELSQIEKAMIANSLFVKDFVVETKDPKKESSKVTIKDLETNRILVIENAKKTLSAPISALLKSIKNNSDITHLKAMKEWEHDHKSREKVLNALDDRINSISASLSLSIGNDLDDSAYFKEAKLPEIEYTVEENITINLGDKE